MERIIPCRDEITDRFPVASFAVHVPPARSFEVACTVDPRLLHSSWSARRTPENFFTSRYGGLLRAPRGETVWFLPSDQLQRFVGARRIYYALATYGGARGEAPRFSVRPDALENVPCIEVSPDFTGRMLGRLGSPVPSLATDAYGGAGHHSTLRWGGDDALERELRSRQATAQAAAATSDDDIFDPSPDETIAVATAVATSVQDAPGGDVESYDTEEFAQTASALSYEYRPDEDPAQPEAPVEAHEDLSAPFESYEEDEDTADLAEASAAPEQEDDVEDTTAVYGGAALLDEAQLDASGRDALYVDSWEDEAPARASVLDARPLDAATKIGILRVVARAESGRDGYQAINADTEFRNPNHPAYQKIHYGLSWGFIQFTQRSGSLGRVLAASRRRETDPGARVPEAQRGEVIFGPQWPEVVAVTNSDSAEGRLAPVGGYVLWEGPWPDRFRAAGAIPHVTYAQNEVAVLDYLDPMTPIAAALGFNTARALAVLVDRAIHMGRAGGLRWIMSHLSPLTNDEAVRRALGALGHTDVAAFQKAAGIRPANGRLDSRTHALLLGALRQAPSAPVAVPSRDDMLKKIGEAAADRPFARRVRALLDNRSDFNDGELLALSQQ